MRQSVQYIIIGILFITLVYKCTETYSLSSEVAAEKQNVKDAEKAIKVLQNERSVLKKEKAILSETVDRLNLDIHQSKSKTTLIQQQSNEKTRAIDTIATGQLQQYFSKRYNRRSAE